MKTTYDIRELDNPFINNIIHSMPEEVQASFTNEQIKALAEALSNTYSKTHHYIDVRTSLHLFFARYYVVFLLGKDLRASVRNRILTRRKKASTTTQVILIGALMTNAVILGLVEIFGILYAIKCYMGIDIFPGFHLRNLLF